MGVCVPIFFGHAKFEVKNLSEFFNYRALWTLNLLEEVSGHQLFLVTLNFFGIFSFTEQSGL